MSRDSFAAENIQLKSMNCGHFVTWIQLMITFTSFSLPLMRSLLGLPLSPARKLSVEILVIEIGPGPGLTAVRVDGGHQVDISGVHQPGDVWVYLIVLTQIP